MATDIINRELIVDDYVMWGSKIYVVLQVPANGHSFIRMALLNTPKTIVRSSNEMCLIPKADMLLYMLMK